MANKKDKVKRPTDRANLSQNQGERENVPFGVFRQGSHQGPK